MNDGLRYSRSFLARRAQAVDRLRTCLADVHGISAQRTTMTTTNFATGLRIGPLVVTVRIVSTDPYEFDYVDASGQRLGTSTDIHQAAERIAEAERSAALSRLKHAGMV